MKFFIEKLREISLRNWIWICIGISVLSMFCLSISSSCSGYTSSILLGVASTLLINVSFTAYAICDDNKISTIVWMNIVGAVFGIIGIIMSFGGLIGSLIDFSSSISQIDLKELAEYYVHESAICQLIVYLIFVVAFAMGMSALKTRYKLPWILLLVFYALTAINLMLYKAKFYIFENYTVINNCLGLLSLTIIIILLVKGSKAENPEVVRTFDLSSSEKSDAKATNYYNTIRHKSDILIRLKELKDSGVISEEEFQSEKTKILMH